VGTWSFAGRGRRSHSQWRPLSSDRTDCRREDRGGAVTSPIENASRVVAGTERFIRLPSPRLLNNLERAPCDLLLAGGSAVRALARRVGQASRSAILRDPPDILLTTAESLEAIL
jgi:hypothetical protein